MRHMAEMPGWHGARVQHLVAAIFGFRFDDGGALVELDENAGLPLPFPSPVRDKIARLLAGEVER